MALVENDDASSFIDPSAENLPSPGLAPQYAASPSPTRWLFNHGGLTWNPVTEMSEEGETSAVHHLQRDSDNHSECGLLFDMVGGMMSLSPPRPGMNFSDEEALFLTPDFHIDMGGGMMMSMNYFSLPSGDSFGNSNPFRLWNFADDSEVQGLENRKGMMMPPTWNQQPPQLCIEGVDAVLGQKNQSLGIWAAENMGLVQQSCWGTHPQTTDDYSVNNVDEWFQLASHDSLPLGLGGSFDPYRFWDDSVGVAFPSLESIRLVTRVTVEYCIERKSATHPLRSGVHRMDMLEFFEKEFADTFNSVQPIIPTAKGGNSSSDKTDTISRWEKDYGITCQVLQQLFGKSRDDAAKTLKVSTSTFKRACRNFGINRWPNHKGKMPNCSLNQKQQHVQAVKKNKGNQSCPALPPEEATTTLHLPPEEATTTTLQGNSAMSVKVTYEDNTIRFPLPSSSTMKYLEEQLETRFKISLEIFSIMYQDEEDDWISLICDSDLMYGMNVLRSSGKTVVKMKINPNFG